MRRGWAGTILRDGLAWRKEVIPRSTFLSTFKRSLTPGPTLASLGCPWEKREGRVERLSDCLVGQKESARHESLLMLKTNTLTQPSLKMSSNLINRGNGIRDLRASIMISWVQTKYSICVQQGWKRKKKTPLDWTIICSTLIEIKSSQRWREIPGKEKEQTTEPYVNQGMLSVNHSWTINFPPRMQKIPNGRGAF